MVPNPNGPRLGDVAIRAMRYSGLFGVRETWILFGGFLGLNENDMVLLSFGGKQTNMQT